MRASATGLLGCLAIALTGPILALNALGGVIAAIWLAFLGEWDVLVGGILLIVIAPIVLSLLLLIRMPVLMVADRFPRSRVVQYLATTMLLLYTVALVTAHSFYVLGNAWGNASQSAAIPALLWAYTVGTSPWVFLARKDEDAQGSPSPAGITTVFAQIAFVTIGIWVLVSSLAFETAVLVFLGIMAVSVVVNLRIFGDPVAPAGAGATPASGPPTHSPSYGTASASAARIITCAGCGQRMKVPSDRGRLNVTCARCGRMIAYDPSC